MKVLITMNGVEVSDGDEKIIIEPRTIDREGAIKIASECQSIEQLKQRIAALGSANE